jgi:hypothetical protein
VHQPFPIEKGNYSILLRGKASVLVFVRTLEQWNNSSKCWFQLQFTLSLFPVVGSPRSEIFFVEFFHFLLSLYKVMNELVLSQKIKKQKFLNKIYLLSLETGLIFRSGNSNQHCKYKVFLRICDTFFFVYVLCSVLFFFGLN